MVPINNEDKDRGLGVICKSMELFLSFSPSFQNDGKCFTLQNAGVSRILTLPTNLTWEELGYLPVSLADTFATLFAHVCIWHMFVGG